MRPAPLHSRETERLFSLRSFEILDTEGESAYDEITRLASEIAETEIALVSLVDEDRQWFKSKHGLDADETHRDLAFCAHAILTPEEPFVIEDATRDPRFHDNPLVNGGPAIRFYAGIPLRSPVDRMPLGTLCAISPRVMALSTQKIEQLKVLARQVERLLSLRRANMQLRANAVTVNAARESAEKANEAKTRLLATISHDMRTPLNGLLGTLNMLEELLVAEDQLELAITAESCAQVLLQLVNDTLELSKIESGTIELESDPFSPERIILETAAVVRATLSSKPVEVRTEIDTSTREYLKGDALRCQQIILNLMSNAAKFTTHGEIVVSSRDVNGIWEISVSDTGPGIPEKDLKKIFEPYIQSQSGLRSRAGGAGLGLNICKRLCEMLGGGISVESTVGEGSTFIARLKLPAAYVHASATEEDEAPPLPQLSVMIAEDDRVSREILTAQLKRLGCTVTATEDGNSAFTTLRKGSFDLVFLDFNMPGMSGPDVADAYRRFEDPDEHLPIFALTARGFEDDRLTCKEAGMDMMLTKPMSQAELEKFLQQFVASMPERALLQLA